MNNGNSMKRQYIQGNYPDKYTAGGKAKIDAEEVVDKLGYDNCGVKRSYYPDKSVAVNIRYLLSRFKVWAGLSKETVLFFQFPSTKAIKFETLAKKKGCRIIMLVHDLMSPRGRVRKSEFQCLSLADVIIVHTDAMKQWLISKGITKPIVILEIFDYLNATMSPIPEKYEAIQVAFAGNLGKSEFLDTLSFNSITLQLFGIGIENHKLKDGLVYKGCFPPDQLSEHMNVHYGLVWDGDSIDTCEGERGGYLKLIAPHKLSMYLSAGIPAIVWEGSAMAKFVKTHEVGLTIKSLKELDSLLPSISKERYEEMRRNVSRLSKSLSEGYYLTTAVKKAEDILQGKSKNDE